MRSWAYNGCGVLMGTSSRASGSRWPSLRGDSWPMITLFPSQGDFYGTAIDQSRLNLPAKHHGGTNNGLTALLTRQAWRQELPCIDGLRQAVKDGAVPEEIGAHGHHNIHRHVMLRCSGK